MLLKFITKITRLTSNLNRRSYFSSRINSLFLDNFDKYTAKIKTDENSHENKTICKLLEDFATLTDSIKDVEKELANKQSDNEMLSLMKEEKVELEAKQNELLANVLNEIHNYETSRDEERIPDSSSVLFEVSAGVGGKEAMLFANELCNMYINYFNFKRWEMSDVESDEQGGQLRHFQARIDGRGVWGFMRFEAGVHRVQRVPETETRGRVHTSTVSIAAIPTSDDVAVEINEKDLRIQTKTATGAGGQHVNKTESAIRITHVPTGIIVECQEDRSQIRNRETAMQRLRKILTDRHNSETFEKTSQTRKSQVGRANRNEKIRTFNYHQDRVTDHRLSTLNISPSEKEDTLYGIEGFLGAAKRLDDFIKSLQRVEKEQELFDILNELNNKAK